VVWPRSGLTSLVCQLKHAAEYLRTDGPVWLTRVTAFKIAGLLWPVLPPVTFKSLRMFLVLGYWPDIRKPRSFNEKIAYRQLCAPHRLAPLVADKWRVRQYVAERGLAHILNEVYFVTDDPDKIPFDDLPDRFAIKANHGCSWNILVNDKTALNRQETIKLCRKWLSSKYSRTNVNDETHYDSITPLLLVEKFIGTGPVGVLLDYKFLCFHGKVHCIYVVDKAGHSTLNCYNTRWEDLAIRYVHPIGKGVPRPAILPEMIDIAERLSRDFDFCRVDLYAPDDARVVFGEITLNPTGGVGRFVPGEWDFRLGELW